ncbi:hypothetical protein EJ08DRAFT_736108 [Tothia fuscella]|uniref:CCHC-type domain-containing protein n=1 Tax=Tothia fuscella TaxID=1048955 RepID=A0A9P4NM70_9PEZI|nr:hypothetical protein EJ08DRAFT_736108 [Tothia fuscella]
MAVLLILYLDNAKANEILSNTKVTLTYLFGHNTCGIEGHDAKECRKVCSHCGKFGHGFDTCDTIKRLEVRALRGSRLMSVSYVEKEIQMNGAKGQESPKEQALNESAAKPTGSKKKAWASLNL